MQTQSNKTKKTVTTKKTYGKAAFVADLNKLHACGGGLDTFRSIRGPLNTVLTKYLDVQTKATNGISLFGTEYTMSRNLEWLLGELYYQSSHGEFGTPAGKRLARALKAAGIDVPRYVG